MPASFKIQQCIEWGFLDYIALQLTILQMILSSQTALRILCYANVDWRSLFIFWPLFPASSGAKLSVINTTDGQLKAVADIGPEIEQIQLDLFPCDIGQGAKGSIHILWLAAIFLPLPKQLNKTVLQGPFPAWGDWSLLVVINSNKRSKTRCVQSTSEKANVKGCLKRPIRKKTKGRRGRENSLPRYLNAMADYLPEAKLSGTENGKGTEMNENSYKYGNLIVCELGCQ